MSEDATEETGPVVMPSLPSRLMITTEQQLKAIADPLRTRILVLLQHQPATTKQLAERLGAVPGTIAHHMQVLETAGLVQIVARRMVHGIQAKYYARAARIFVFDIPREVAGNISVQEDFIDKARDEVAESVATLGEDAFIASGFPHMRLSPDRVEHYRQRLEALIDEVLAEAPDPHGRVYGLLLSFFEAPAVLQPDETEGGDRD